MAMACYVWLMMGHGIFLLWNPLTADFMRMPEPSLGREFLVIDESSYIGFGHDKTVDDYKIVRVVSNWKDGPLRTNVEMYTLKTISWRQMDEDFSVSRLAVSLFYQGVHLNGTLHRLVVTLDHKHGDPYLDYHFSSIAAFDLVDEKLQFLPRPEPWKLYASPEILGECLCVLTHSSSLEVGIGVWVMTKHGGNDSWTNIVNVKHPILNPSQNGKA